MSRPTRPARWFLTQFSAGFGLFLGFVYLPFLAMFAVSSGIITSRRDGVVDVSAFFVSVLLMHGVTYFHWQLLSPGCSDNGCTRCFLPGWLL
jgi:hypothetical protein